MRQQQWFARSFTGNKSLKISLVLIVWNKTNHLTKQILTVNHQVIDGFFCVDVTVEPTSVLSVVLFLQWGDNNSAHVIREHHAGAGRQFFAIFEPNSFRYLARLCLATEVSRAVASDEDSGRTSDVSTWNWLCERKRDRRILLLLTCISNSSCKPH